jgi:hypothetical protein
MLTCQISKRKFEVAASTTRLIRLTPWCIRRWSLSSPSHATPTQPGSPSLRTYGTFESIQRSIASKDSDPPDSIPSESGARNQPLPSPTPFASATASRIQPPNQFTEWDIVEGRSSSGTQEISSFAAGWADGMYDFESARARFDLADSSLIYDTDFDWMNLDTQFS